MDEPSDKKLGRRLFVAFLLCSGLALICWRVLPRAGVLVPWYMPVLGFAIILFSTLAPRLDPGEGKDDDEGHGGSGGEPGEGDDPVAGRIGPGPG